MDSNHRPHAYQACALTTWAMRPVWWRWGGSNSWPPACKAGALPAELHPRRVFEVSLQDPSKLNNVFLYFPTLPSHWPFRVQTNSFVFYSLERRWSSRTFRYGYLVTTSPQSLTPPSTASPLRLDYRLRVLPTLMVWRAVCTRPGNVFTAAFWSAITSNSDFMQAGCSLQSELGRLLWGLLRLAASLPFVFAIVVRV